MNHNETGYLQETIPGRQSSRFPFAPLRAKRGNIHSLGRRAALMPRRKLSEHSRHRPTFRVRTFNLKRRSPRLLGGMFRLLAWVLFTTGESLIDDTVNFGPSR